MRAEMVTPCLEADNISALSRGKIAFTLQPHSREQGRRSIISRQRTYHQDLDLHAPVEG